MKERLNQFTVQEFIDVVCDETSMLTGADDAQKVRRNIILEYHDIADPKGARSYLRECEKIAKLRVTISMLEMCANLISLGATDSVRSVLTDAGIKTAKMTDRRVAIEVKSRLARAKNSLSQMDGEESSGNFDADTIRRNFDAQTAALMAHFKFQIDISTMKANIYAHLIARHNSDINAQLKAMKKK